MKYIFFCIASTFLPEKLKNALKNFKNDKLLENILYAVSFYRVSYKNYVHFKSVHFHGMKTQHALHLRNSQPVVNFLTANGCHLIRSLSDSAYNNLINSLRQTFYYAVKFNFVDYIEIFATNMNFHIICIYCSVAFSHI